MFRVSNDNTLSNSLFLKGNRNRSLFFSVGSLAGFLKQSLSGRMKSQHYHLAIRAYTFDIIVASPSLLEMFRMVCPFSSCRCFTRLPETLVMGCLDSVIFLDIYLGNRSEWASTSWSASYCGESIHSCYCFLLFMIEIWSATRPMKNKDIPNMVNMTAPLENRSYMVNPAIPNPIPARKLMMLAGKNTFNRLKSMMILKTSNCVLDSSLTIFTLLFLPWRSLPTSISTLPTLYPSLTKLTSSWKWESIWHQVQHFLDDLFTESSEATSYNRVFLFNQVFSNPSDQSLSRSPSLYP